MASGKNYFEDLLCNDDVMRHGSLDRLVDEINETKDRTIYKFLSDSGSEDFLWSLVTLLSSSETRVASNAAYVIGSLAETELGAQRVLSLTKGRKAASIMKHMAKNVALLKFINKRLFIVSFVFYENESTSKNGNEAKNKEFTK
uniref:uncharacterized protein LOC108949740 n=1 Tax=Ciona intestinalis TaxID=7719 RepID=UPI00089DC61B|nr:uncharacterized protein LOC108949740 [Ciona intestinalis]|eukprot:XP_018668705.1 uncharacterized protein LOC108949740 [Ciona intestinalis]